MERNCIALLIKVIWYGDTLEEKEVSCSKVGHFWMDKKKKNESKKGLEKL